MRTVDDLFDGDFVSMLAARYEVVPNTTGSICACWDAPKVEEMQQDIDYVG